MMKITRKNPLSGKEISRYLPITDAQLDLWQKGGYTIQRAVPHLTPDEREFVLTGLTPQDWNSIFSGSYLEDVLQPLTDWFLGGSRSFEDSHELIKVNKHTDYDIVAPLNEQNLHFVEQQADEIFYRENFNPEYAFDETTAVIAKFYSVPELNNVELQISLRTEYPMVKAIWNTITPDFYYNYLWKRNPTLSNDPSYRETIRDVLQQLYAIYRLK